MAVIVRVSARIALLGSCLVTIPVPSTAAQMPGIVTWSIEPASGGPPILAAGDTLSLAVFAYRCWADVCERLQGHPRRVRWSTGDAGVVRIDDRGRLRARTPGRTVVTAEAAGRRLTFDLRVIGPVRALGWTTVPRVGTVGDTLRVAVVARDSGGRAVARIAVSAHVGGTGRSGEIVRWDDGGYTLVYLDRTGLLVLVARLAHRTDTLRLLVLAGSGQ